MQSDKHNDLELGPAEMAEISAMAQALRADLDTAAARPPFFWTRQQARVRERISARPTRLRRPIAAMGALAALSFALLSVKPPAPAPAPVASVQAVDADDLLLQNIQHSLSHHAPDALMPASVLVQEMTSDSNHQQKRDN